VLGAAALLMLAAGWVVHLEADTGPRAESFLAQQTSARVAAQLHRVSAMTCRLETGDTQGRVRQFTIEWRDTGEAEVRAEGPEGTRQRTIHPRSRIVNVLTAAHEGSLHATSPPDPPELGPARTHLTPERLASLLAGRWELVRGPSEAEPGVATFSVSGADRWDVVRVTIDSETYLPVSVAQTPSGPESAGSTGVTWTRARLAWPPAPPAPRLLGDHPRSATRPATSWS
jgi:hypothetical protein